MHSAASPNAHPDETRFVELVFRASGRIVYPLANAFFVQWNRSARRRRTLYAGSLV